MKHLVIWSDRNINPDDWKESYAEFIEANDLDEDPDDEYKLWEYINETLGYYLDDECANLNKETEGRILAIADLGLWNGRRQGYKILTNNVNSIFTTGDDYTEYYSDGYNIRGTGVHHDGTNFYEYRVIREDRNIQNLLDAIYNGEKITRKKLNYYTKSLHPYVAKVYGW
jgi:hypothetical protein